MTAGRSEGCARDRAVVRPLLWVLCSLGAAQPVLAQEPARGTLHIVWDTDDRTESAAEYYLVEAGGRSHLLQLDMSDAAAAQLVNLDRRTVELRGTRPVETDARQPTVEVREVRRAATAMSNLSAGGPGVASYDFITILCRFPDDPEPAFTRAAVEAAHGSSYPGLRHFYAELSWNPAIMSGSRVTDWYTLPRPRADYVTSTHTSFGTLANDCTRAAEQDVHFPAYFGINLQFSSGLSRRMTAPYDTLSFGGSWTLTLNGETRSWGMTWLSGPHATNYVVLAHEVGHALGWPHSSGGYGGEYDSEWDVMSRGYLRWEPPYGWLGVHTISQHKDAAGWVPAERRWTPGWGTMESGLLARTALPPQEGYLFARIPAGSNSFYTAESRQLAGHDRPLPAEAVVLHRVTYQRAFVVDVDGNGDPNDVGAQWHPGQEFQDSVSGFSLRVDSASSAGFHVSVTRGWRLDAAADGPGGIIITANGARTECADACSTVATVRGAAVVVEAVASASGVFSHWEGDCASAQSCSLTLHGNREVRAVFQPSVAIVAGLAQPVMGADYRDRVTLTGGAGPVSWSVVDGSLPPGLALDPDSGAIFGVPTAAGAYAFTLLARRGAAELRREAVLTVTQPALGVDAVIDQLLGSGALTDDEVRFLDLLGNRNGRLDVGDVRQWLKSAELTPAQQVRVAPLLRAGSR